MMIESPLLAMSFASTLDHWFGCVRNKWQSPCRLQQQISCRCSCRNKGILDSPTSGGIWLSCLDLDYQPTVIIKVWFRQFLGELGFPI
jgi:hypothetical protein